MPSIWYIHGAGATPRSFAWLSSALPPHISHAACYTIDEGVSSIIDRLTHDIVGNGGPISIIGHSLGGALGNDLLMLPQVERLVSICAPFGGIVGAELAALFRTDAIFRDVAAYGPFLRRVRRLPTQKPHLAIVGTGGLPFLSGPNDGVVTVASQTAKDGPEYRFIDLNHYEVLMATETAAAIRDFAFAAESVL